MDSRGRVLIVGLLVAVLGTLTAVAYATPPDPLYIAGFWDDDDYDNVVILATSSKGTADSHTQAELTHVLVLIAPVPGAKDAHFSRAFSAPNPPRAPPAA